MHPARKPNRKALQRPSPNASHEVMGARVNRATNAWLKAEGQTKAPIQQRTNRMTNVMAPVAANRMTGAFSHAGAPCVDGRKLTSFRPGALRPVKSIGAIGPSTQCRRRVSA